MATANTRKITISLPAELVEFADHQASYNQTSRSQVIGQALAQVKAQNEQRLAAEGYEFYAQEAVEFATAIAQAVAEAIDNGR